MVCCSGVKDNLSNRRIVRCIGRCYDGKLLAVSNQQDYAEFRMIDKLKVQGFFAEQAAETKVSNRLVAQLLTEIEIDCVSGGDGYAQAGNYTQTSGSFSQRGGTHSQIGGGNYQMSLA